MTTRLYYKTPAQKWRQGVPLGNGRLGAMVASEHTKETWTLTDSTFWSGKREPIPEGSYGGKEALKIIREKFVAGDFNAGEELAAKWLQPEKINFGTNLTTAEIIFEEDRSGFNVNEFERDLSLDTAVAKTYLSGKVIREGFASHADQVLVFRSTSSRLSFHYKDVKLVHESDGLFTFETQALEKIHSDGTCGVKAVVATKVVTDGHVANDSKVTISNATYTTVYMAISTDLTGEDPDPRSVVNTAASKDYEELKNAHIADHAKLFSRVALSINTEVSKQDEDPTDVRIDRYRSHDFNDANLSGLFFQFSRYLVIAGSREDSTLPLGLQGLWNDGEANAMNWSCDYHLDINTQMNYWPVEVSNLSECHVPLAKFVKRISELGRDAAQKFYGADGWVTHVFTNVWGFASPGWETCWGLNVTGGLWIASHLMYHYNYTRDEAFLQADALPVLVEAAKFFLDYMFEDPRSGYYVTGPSPSPENSFLIDGKEHHLSLGCTIDIVLVRDLFNFLLKHDRSSALNDRIQKVLPKLPPLQIASNGQLMEWIEDYKEAQPDHRHLSHTIALCKSDQIQPGTPLADAVRQTLENRRSRAELEDIEFTAAMFGTNYARLYDHEKALSHVGHLIGELSFDNLFTYSKSGVAGADTDIFVLDGNPGGAAVVGEMLLQSHRGVIELLPALPDSWSSGTFSGLVAMGPVEVDVEWLANRVTVAKLRPKHDGQLSVRVNGATVQVDGVAGQEIVLEL